MNLPKPNSKLKTQNSKLVFILLLLLLGCDSGTTTPSPTAFGPGIEATLPPNPVTPSPTSPPPPTPVNIARGGTLTLRLSQDLTNFDPLLNAGRAGADWVNHLLFNGLTRLDARGVAQPDLAESWQASADGLQLTFKLRAGVMWHDGEGFSSDDVLFTYNAWANLSATTRLQADLAASGAQFTAPDPLTVVVKLQHPFAPLLADLSAPIVPAHLLKNVPIDKLADAPFSFQPVGTGPFKWGQRDAGQNIVLDANPKYYRGPAYLDRIAFLISGSDKVAAAALGDGRLLAGELAYPQYSDLSSAAITTNLSFGDYPADGYYFLAFNLRSGRRFNDYRLRRAFAFALDRDAIVKQATGGEGLAIWSTALPGTWAYQPATPRYPQDQPQARQLLADAGWADSTGDGAVEHDGKPLTVNLYVRADDPLRRVAAQQIAMQEASIGISVTVVPADYASAMLARIDPRRNPPFDFDVMLMGWSDLGYDYDPYRLLASNLIPAPDAPSLPNYVGYNNANFDRNAQQAEGMYDYAARQQADAALQLTLAEELPYYPLWASRHFVVGSKRIAVADGSQPAWSSPYWLWNVEQWYFVK